MNLFQSSDKLSTFVDIALKPIEQLLDFKHQMDQRIRVVVRKRPLNLKERQRGDLDLVRVNSPRLVLEQPKRRFDLTPYLQRHQFKFDAVYDQHQHNQAIFQKQIKPLVKEAFEGAYVTCFAYGQTGTGKTFTMMGQSHIKGIYEMAVEQIFSLQRDSRTQIQVSFYQIYSGKLFDLLNQRKQLVPREDARGTVNIVGLRVQRVVQMHQLLQIINFGLSFRVSSQNAINVGLSSRSHAILNLEVLSRGKANGKIVFVDLAGSERGKDHSNLDKLASSQISKSLLALKQCIRAIDLGKQHTPFRCSKLTIALKDCFTGNCRSLMIGNISPSSQCCQSTLNTLAYAQRLKALRGSKSNDSPSQLYLPRSRSPLKSKPLFINNLLEEKEIGLFRQQSNTKQSIVLRQNQLIELILNEQDDFISQHRKYMELNFRSIQEDMHLIQNKASCNQLEYRERVCIQARVRMRLIVQLQSKLASLLRHLSEEERLQSQYRRLSSF